MFLGNVKGGQQQSFEQLFWNRQYFGTWQNFALFCVILAASLTVIYAILRGSESNYILIIDAGSSGTRIYGYEYKDERPIAKLSRIQPIQITTNVPRKLAGPSAQKRIETLGGVDQCLTHQQLRNQCLGPLMVWAKSAIPANQIRKTPVLMFATAGLRQLEESRRNRLIENIRIFLSNSGFRFEREWFKVISGEEEGALGWLTINYETLYQMAHDLAQSPNLATKIQQSTSGMLDLGGSSFELTHLIVNSSDGFQDDEAQNLQTVKLHNLEFNLSTHVYQRYGLDQAFDRSVTYLLAEGGVVHNFAPSAEELSGKKEDMEQQNQSRGSGRSTLASKDSQIQDEIIAEIQIPEQNFPEDVPVVRHPCVQKGYQKEYQRKLTAKGIPTPPAVEIIGEPDWQKCNTLTKLIVQGKDLNFGCGTREEIKEFCISTQIPEGMQFVATQGFHVVVHYFPQQPLDEDLISDPENKDNSQLLQTLQNQGKDFCSWDYERVELEKSDDNKADRHCFWTPYVIQLIQTGLKMDPNLLSVSSDGAGWTQGAALVYGSQLVQEGKFGKSNSSYFGRYDIIFILFLLCLGLIGFVFRTNLYPYIQPYVQGRGVGILRGKIKGGELQRTISPQWDQSYRMQRPQSQVDITQSNTKRRGSYINLSSQF